MWGQTMKQTTRIIPCYAADTSGVCAALYELGGMVAVHDASGALLRQEAICDGYAKALVLLLRCAGIPASVVSGA